MIKIIPLFLATVAITASTLPLTAQVKTPAPSPASELKQTIGITDFTVAYSRPSVKERDIYGELVPYGSVWRTGANAPTKITFDSEITFGDKKVPAGEYILFTIPGDDQWTVILYGDTEISGAGLYDEKNDVARVTVKPEELDDEVETFTIGFDDLRDDSATLFLDWDDVRVPVPITIDTNALSGASLEAALKSIDTWTARDYANASDYYVANNKDLAQATEWMKKAAEMNKNAFWWQYAYAALLAKQDKKQEAIAATETALATAKAAPGGASGYVKKCEDLLAKLK
ncbi:MAG: DUF2911 domain-containing protein [Chthoniobacterales bacterium]